jgi:prepilin-type N-terminal cleavage/methylation domain-containing protein
MQINKMSLFKELNSKGMTLVEVIVSAAILAIIAVTMATAFLTMGNVSVKTADTKAADAGLESSIAAEAEESGYKKSTSVAGVLEIPDSSGSSIYTIPLESYTYSSEKTDQGFTVFKFSSP